MASPSIMRHRATRVFLEPFQLASRPVTCAEYLDFINCGGYERPELWLSEGWDTVQAQGWRAPLYWQHEQSGEWTVFTMRGRVPLNAFSFDAGLPCQLLRGRRLRQLGGKAASYRSRNGKWQPPNWKLKAICWRAADFILRQATRRFRVCSRCLGTYGSGREAPIPAIRDISRCRVRSANTTENS